MLFGATGDLAKRKLFPALYHLERHGELDVPVIGVARSDWTDDDFRTARPRVDRGARRRRRRGGDRRRCASGSTSIQGDYADPATWEALRRRRSTSHELEDRRVLHGDPADDVPDGRRVAGLGRAQRARPDRRREAVRPRPAVGASSSTTTLHAVFPEERIFRIDHYLGKEAVEDLLVFRFSNTLLEPVWNRNYVRSVQVTMSETIGVEGRGAFYDAVGAIRDVLQNHLLQVVVAAGDGAAGRARRRRSCRTRRPRCSRRWSRSTRRRSCAASTSATATSRASHPTRTIETFVAARLRDRLVALGRRAVVRARRQGARRTTPPRPSSSCASRRSCCSTRPAGRRPSATSIRFRLGKHDGVTFTLQAKTPGPHLDSQEVDIAVDFAAALGERHEAYERLLGDAIDGSPRRFAREDVVEQTWRVVQPALDEPGPIHPYFRGTWGPSEADRVLGGDNWFEPS